MKGSSFGCEDRPVAALSSCIGVQEVLEVKRI